MFIIECRINKDNTIGKWFPIWHSEDGADCADYLRDCELGCGYTPHQANRSQREYRMIYKINGE